MWWIICSYAVGVGVGWLFRAKSNRHQVVLKGRDKIIFDGFDRYLEITEELHPQDPRQVQLTVVDGKKS